MYLQGFRSTSDLTRKRTDFQVSSGNGSPQGSVSGSVGDLYLQHDTANVFQSTGSTNWQQLTTVQAQTTFTLANNQSAAANVTGLTHSSGSVVSVNYHYKIKRTTSTTKLFEVGHLIVFWDDINSIWRVTVLKGGDESNTVFSITAAGQLQYTTDNQGGTTYVGELKIKEISRIT